VIRLGIIIGFIALVGVLLSGLAAYRVHDQELRLSGIALARAIDVHAILVQDRLTERELLARVANASFSSIPYPHWQFIRICLTAAPSKWFSSLLIVDFTHAALSSDDAVPFSPYTISAAVSSLLAALTALKITCS
jgi:CHASE1-domain containing sensor protein